MHRFLVPVSMAILLASPLRADILVGDYEIVCSPLSSDHARFLMAAAMLLCGAALIVLRLRELGVGSQGA